MTFPNKCVVRAVLRIVRLRYSLCDNILILPPAAHSSLRWTFYEGGKQHVCPSRCSSEAPDTHRDPVIANLRTRHQSHARPHPRGAHHSAPRLARDLRSESSRYTWERSVSACAPTADSPASSARRSAGMSCQQPTASLACVRGADGCQRSRRYRFEAGEWYLRRGPRPGLARTCPADARRCRALRLGLSNTHHRTATTSP